MESRKLGPTQGHAAVATCRPFPGRGVTSCASMLFTKWLTNFSVPIDFGFNEENQNLAALLRLAGKALYIIANLAPCIDMLVRNISMWSIGIILLIRELRCML